MIIAAVLALVVGGTPAAVATTSAPTPARLTVPELKPDIVWKPIPFGARRRDQMAGYSKRHYGKRTWELTDPQVILQHYTDGTTWQGAWNTFASNSRHNGEKPGTCTHFIVDTDGTIYQLVNLGVRCRHVVGLNYTSVGIEHVGTSDAMVLNNDRQMASSLALTVWLMARFDVNTGNVIGHREALQSPYHLELYPDWRCLVHADFPHRAMRVYRERLRDLARSVDVAVGDPPVWEPSGC